MRCSTLLFMAAAAVGVMAQDDSCTNLALASCLAAPLTASCNDVACACSQLAAQTDCYKSICTTVDPSVLSTYSSVCTAGGAGAAGSSIGSAAATGVASAAASTTPPGSSASTATDNTAAGAATTPTTGSGATSAPTAKATGNSAPGFGAPIGGLLAVGLGAVAYL